MIELAIETKEYNLRIISSDITMLAEEGIYEQVFAQFMGWA